MFHQWRYLLNGVWGLAGAVPTPSVVLDTPPTGFASLRPLKLSLSLLCCPISTHCLGPFGAIDSTGHFGDLRLFPVGLILLSPVPISTSLALTEMRLSPQSSSELPCFFNTVEITRFQPCTIDLRIPHYTFLMEFSYMAVYGITTLFSS